MTPDIRVEKVSESNQKSPSSSATYEESHDTAVTLLSAYQALRDYNREAEGGNCAPLFFQNDRLVIVSPDDEGNLAVKNISQDKLRLILTKCGTWSGGKRSTKDHGGYPSMDTVKMIYTAGYDTLNDKDFPVAVPILKGIHTGVMLDADWQIVHTKGYNEKTKLYLAKDYEIDPVPETVTEEHVKAARNLLWDIYGEFLFSDAEFGEESVNYQNTIAALASAVIRPFWEGVLPVFLVDKSNSGTGGTLLQEITVILAFGVPHESIQRIGFPEKGKSSEYEKTLKAAILKRKEYGLIDNVPRSAEWAIDTLLSQVTGCGTTEIRPLGGSTEVSCGPSMYYMVNGINLRMTPIDVTRRIIPVRIVSKKSLSELNGYFKRLKEELYQHAEQVHPQVIRAMAIFRKNWIQKGRPYPKPCSGNILEYQTWYNEICGMLSAAGYTKILDNLGETQTDDNEDEAHAKDFIMAIKGIEESMGDGKGCFTPSQLLDEINLEVKCIRDEAKLADQPILPYLDDEIAQAAFKGILTPDSLGKYLSTMKETKFTGCRYRLMKKRGKSGIQYYLEEVLKQEKITT